MTSIFQKITMAASGVAMLAGVCGCLFEPAAPTERLTGVDLVGPPGSAAPLRAGQTSRPQALNTLGNPSRVSSDGRAVEYDYQPVTTHVGFIFIGGPCGLCGYYPFQVHGSERLWLAFNDDGTLTRYATSRDHTPTDWDRFQAATAAAR